MKGGLHPRSHGRKVNISTLYKGELKLGVSSRAARATQRNPVSNETNKKEKLESDRDPKAT